MARIDGTSRSDRLFGRESGVLPGGAGVDTLFGYGGDDQLFGEGYEEHRLVGGEGDDVYFVDQHSGTWFFDDGGTIDFFSEDVVVEEEDEGVDTVYFTLNGVYPRSYTLPDNVENLIVEETGWNYVSAFGNALDNSIVASSAVRDVYGGLGDDTIQGAGGGLLDGGDGDDTI